jgi:hypothetical protein
MDGIDIDYLTDAADSVDEIWDNFDVYSQSYKTYCKSSTGDTYEITENYYLKIIPTDGTFVSQDCSIEATVEYKNKASYPSTISVVINYETGQDIDKLETIGLDLFGNIANLEIESSLQRCTYGADPKLVYNDEDAEVYVSKSKDVNSGIGYKIVSLTASINFPDTAVGIIKDPNMEDFDMSNNPSFELFNTTLMDYQESLESINNHVAELYESQDGAEITYASDSVIYDEEGGTYSNAHVTWRVTCGDMKYTVDASAVCRIDNDGNKTNTFYVDVAGKSFSDADESIDWAATVLSKLTDSTIDLSEYHGQTEICIDISGDNLSNNVGYPAIATVTVEEYTTLDKSTIYRANVNLSTDEESIMAEQVDDEDSEETSVIEDSEENSDEDIDEVEDTDE